MFSRRKVTQKVFEGNILITQLDWIGFQEFLFIGVKEKVRWLNLNLKLTYKAISTKVLPVERQVIQKAIEL